MVLIKYSEIVLLVAQESSLLSLPELVVVAGETPAFAVSGAGLESESLTPVKKNLLCFAVCSLAEWMGRSQSLHKIALSS